MAELRITTLPNSFLNAQHSEISENQSTAKGIVARQIYSAWSGGCLKPNPPNVNHHHTIDFIKSPKSLRKEPSKFTGIINNISLVKKSIYFKLESFFLYYSRLTKRCPGCYCFKCDRSLLQNNEEKFSSQIT